MALRFRRLGRSLQAEILNVDDLALVPALPDALWAATAAPTDTLRLDKGFLALLDGDGDGRIRSDELKAAITWTLGVFAETSGIRPGNTVLDPAALASGGDGSKIREAARRVQAQVGSKGTTVSLEDVRKLRAEEEGKGLSAAGRVLPAAAGDDAALRRFLDRVIEVTGGEPHPTGDKACTAATLDRYLAETKDWLAWTDAPSGDPAILPVEGTADALAAHDAVAAKLEQYFLLCDTVHLDPDVATRQWVEAKNADLLDPATAATVLEKAPLARPRVDGILDPAAGLNPAWRARIEAWLRSAVAPLGLDGPPIDRALVAAVALKLAAYRAWQGKKPATKAGEAGLELARAHLAEASFAERVRELLTRTEAASVALDGVKLVEKAILMQAWLIPFANTMVAFPDLVDTKVKGWVERGTLIMDGRVFDLAIKVTDPGRSERFAAMSPLYTMFVKVGEKGGTLDEEFVVPVTAGEREHLVDGMWGVFFDVDGRERHAQIRKMIVNPISIKEAILAPFRKIGDAIQSALDQAAASQSDAMTTSVTSHATTAAGKTANVASTVVAHGEAAKTAPPPPPPAPGAPAPVAVATTSSPLGSLPMLVAGLGIAAGAIGAFLTEAFATLFSATAKVSSALADVCGQVGLPETTQTAVAAASFPFALFLVVLGVVLVPFLVYATPVAIATWFRLRRRDLSTLLEGSGWAMNTRMYLDQGLAAKLTTRPKAPR